MGLLYGKMAELTKQITRRLERRPARIDKADRLWDAAVLVPLIDTENGPAVLLKYGRQVWAGSPAMCAFPGSL